jgi:hypothetical protein
MEMSAHKVVWVSLVAELREQGDAHKDPPYCLQGVGEE